MCLKILHYPGGVIQKCLETQPVNSICQRSADKVCQLFCFHTISSYKIKMWFDFFFFFYCNLMRVQTFLEFTATVPTKTSNGDSPWCWLWSCCCYYCWRLHELGPKARGGTQGHHAESFPETENHIWPLCPKERTDIIIILSLCVNCRSH